VIFKMTIWNGDKLVVRIAAVVAFLAGCSGGASSGLEPASSSGIRLAPTLLNERSTLGVVTGAGLAVHADRGESWMSPGAKTNDLLYVSDAATNDVYVYQYPALKLTGTLKGFAEPQGECTDSKGNVWIANTNKREIVQFAHGGTKQIRALSDPSGYPLGCAVDGKTGDLAVTNIFDLHVLAGAVLVYKGASGKPKSYKNSSQYYYYFDGYDSSGNLYASGRDPSGFYILSVLPSGKSSMSTVALSGPTLSFPGTVTWVGKSLVLGDQRCGGADASCLYEASISGTSGTITGTTPFTGACDVVQASIVSGKTVVGGDYEYCDYASSSVDLWAYPTGDSPTKKVTGAHEPIGSAISN
jgi:hypothetical protein